MKQRACIAQAISLNPQLILADEPTSALDVVVQRQIMQTLRQLQHQLNATVLLVGHDMGLMAQFAERVGIMYGGKLVEVGQVEEIFHNPQHPYTQLLISSIPSLRPRASSRVFPGSDCRCWSRRRAASSTLAVPKPCPSVASANLPCKRSPPTT